MAPYIRHPFLLLTSNSGYSVPRNNVDKAMLDSNKFLVKWFAKNPSIFHAKIVAIPLGLTDRRVIFTPLQGFDQLLRDIPPFYDPTKNTGEKRDILALLQYSDNTNPFRKVARKAFGGIATMPPRGTPKDQWEFYRKVRRSKFVVSPPGGLWEEQLNWGER